MLQQTNPSGIVTILKQMKKSPFIIVAAILICPFTIFGQISHLWSIRTGKDFINQPKQIIADSQDNIILAGVTASASDVSTDILLSKYTSNGDSLWSYYIGKTGNNEIVDGLCIDDSNNIYITGCFKGIVNFGSYNGSTHTLSSSGDYDMFVARFDPKGQIQWVTKYGATIQEFGKDLIYNSSDKIILAVGYSNVTATSKTEGIVLKINPQTGKIEKSKNLSSSENLKISQIEQVTPTIYQISGSFSGALGSYYAKGAHDIFIGQIESSSITVNIYFTKGSSADNSVIDMVSLNEAHSLIAFEDKNTSSIDHDNILGEFQSYSSRFRSEFELTGNLSAVCSHNNSSYFAGSYVDNLNLGKLSYFSKGLNIFIGKLLPSYPIFLYLQSFPVTQGLITDNHIRMTNLSNGDIVLAGIFADTLKFDNSNNIVVAKSIGDMFIARFDVQSSEAIIEEIDIEDVSKFTYDKPNSSDIRVHVPIGTDLSDLQLTFRISENSSISPDPSTIHDYRTEVNYTITSEDTKTINYYRIAVVADLENNTNISNTTNNSFSIYPNPATQTIQLKIPENFGNNMKGAIRSIDGRIIQEVNIYNKQINLDINHLKPGIYFITISSGSQQFSSKFVKQ
jgi:hypothetical protein